jgi:citrate lyase subunit beta/citryl-CoA lyase
MNGPPATAVARTYLFVPGNRPDRHAKALASAADQVVLDLEDAVDPAEKARARDAVAATLDAASPEQRERLVVRINDAGTDEYPDDLAMLRAVGARTVMLPKAEHAAQIEALRRTLPHLAVLPLVESALGVTHASRLAQAEGVVRLVFGTLDFALDLDLSGDPVGLDHACSLLSLASRAARIASPVAGVTTEVSDDQRLLRDLARARAHGFGAKLCIHPRQLEPVHAALRPTREELAWAQRVVEASTGGEGAFRLDGRMVDRPVVQRAHALLARASRP